MDIEGEIRNIVRETPPPPGLPENLKEAREFAHYGAVFALIMAGIFFLVSLGYFAFAIFNIFNIVRGGVLLTLAFLAFLLAIRITREFIPKIDAQNMDGLTTEGFILTVLGFIVGFIPGLAMLISLLKINKSI